MPALTPIPAAVVYPQQKIRDQQSLLRKVALSAGIQEPKTQIGHRGQGAPNDGAVNTACATVSAVEDTKVGQRAGLRAL